MSPQGEEAGTSNTSSSVRLKRLLRGDPESDSLIGPVIARIQDFIRLFDADTPADILADKVWGWYAAKYDGLGLWVALEDGQVCGHLLSIVDTFHGVPYINVNQLWLDKGGNKVTREGWAETMEWVKLCAIEMKMDKIMVRMSTHHRNLRYFERFGFRFSKMVAHMEVKV